MILFLACMLPAQAPPVGWIDSWTLGQAHLSSGDLAPARAEFEHALELRPRAENTAYALACVAARQGDGNGARAWLDRAVAWGYADADVAGFDPDLASVRERDEFPALIQRMRAEARAADARSESARIATMGQAWSADVSPNGDALVVCCGPDMFLMDMATSEIVSVMPSGGGWFEQAIFSPDGRFIASTEREGRVRLWNASDGALLQSTAPSTCDGRLAFRSDEKQLFGSGNATGDVAVLFDVEPWRLLARLQARSQAGQRFAAASPSRDVVLIGEDFDPKPTVLLKTLDGARTLASIELPEPSPCGGINGDFGPRGTHAFVRTWNSKRLYVVDADHPEDVVRIESGEFLRAAFSADERGLAVYDGKQSLVVYDTASGTMISRSALSVADADPWSVAFDASGTYLFVNDGKRDHLLRAADANEVWHRDDASVRAVQFACDRANIVVVRATGVAEVLRVSDGKLVQSIVPGNDQRPVGIRCVEPSPDGRMLALGCFDGSLRLLDAATGATRRVLQVHTGWVQDAQFSPDGSRLATSGDDGMLRITRVADGASLAAVHAFPGGGDLDWPTPTLSYSADGKRILTCGQAPGASLWDADTCERLAELREPDASVIRIATWNPDSTRVVTASDTGVVRVWDARTGNSVFGPFRHPKPVDDIAVDVTGTLLATACEDARARVWKLGSVAEPRIFSHADQDLFGDLAVGCVAFSPDGKRLLTTSYSWWEVRVFDIESGERLWSFEYPGGNEGAITAAFSADGKRVLVAHDGRVLDAQDGHTIDVRAPERSSGAESVVDHEREYTWENETLVATDMKSHAILYACTPHTERGRLAQAASLHADGTRGALRSAHVVLGDGSAPLECYASLLFDPKRVRAGAAGVQVARPRLPKLPRIIERAPASRAIEAEGASVVVRIVAEDEGGLLGFEVERDGVELAREEVVASVTRGESSRRATLSLRVDRPASGADVNLRLVAVGNSGLTSRPVLATLHFVAQKR